MTQTQFGQLSDFFLRVSPDVTQPIRGEKPAKVESQLESWFHDLEVTRKTDSVFELEMWLRAVDRFFMLENQPFSQEIVRNITAKDFLDELRILRSGVERMGHLVSLILSKGDVSYSRFEDFLESNINRYYGMRPKERTVRHQNGFAEAVDLLGEALSDFCLVLGDLCSMPKISFHTFLSTGRLLSREVKRNGYLAYLLERKFKPSYDRISNPYVCRAVYEAENSTTKKELARLFLDFYRILRYLDHIGRDLQRESYLKRHLLLFCLVRHEVRHLQQHIRQKSLAAFDPIPALREAIDSVSYAVEMESKKVFNFELIDLSEAQSTEQIKIKIENSYGILKRGFQEATVTLLQAIYPGVRGEEIFDSYVTRQSQSVQLRRDLNVLFEQVRAFLVKRKMDEANTVIRYIVDFQQSSLKHLMYKDWQEFDLFLNEIKRAKTLPALMSILHKFETFLASLLIEIGKRSAFINLSLEKDRGQS